MGRTRRCTPAFPSKCDGQAQLARFALICTPLLFTPAGHTVAASTRNDTQASRAESQKKGAGHVQPQARDTVKSLENALRHTTSLSESRALTAQANALRLRSLSPAVMTLLRAGRDRQRANRLSEAEQLISSALTLAPEHAIIWRFRAMVRAQGQDVAGAIADLGIALQHDPNDAESWTLLAQLEAQRGDRSAAQRATVRANEIDPMSRQSRENPGLSHGAAPHLKL